MASFSLHETSARSFVQQSVESVSLGLPVLSPWEDHLGKAKMAANVLAVSQARERKPKPTTRHRVRLPRRATRHNPEEKLRRAE